MGGDDPTRPRSARGTDDDGLRPGRVIGRYVIVRRLGEGGHGHVFAAHDRVLEREIALKVLASSADGDDLAPQWQAALGEAQTLAKLSHANVVAVHDVGIDEGYVWVSMEKVDGIDLATHLQRTRPTPAQLAGWFAAAARGLAAAHAAGIVHRDVKPSNLMVRADGRLQVADFGLGRAVALDPSVPDGSATEHVGSTLGAGTPTYMAPEQHTGLAVGPPADVYALCVSAIEALTGRPPFVGPDLATAKLHGLPLESPVAKAVPAPLRDILVRGLSSEPATRPALVDLIAAFDRAAAPVRRRVWPWLAAAAGIVAVAGAGATVWALARPLSPTSPPPPQVGAAAPPWCASANRFADVWNEDARDALAASLARGNSAESLAPLGRILDARATAWEAARAQLCAPGTADSQAHELRATCLDERRDETAAAIALAIERAPEASVQAYTLARSLAPIERCADVRTLARRDPLPDDPATRRAIVETTAQVHRAKAHRAVGRFAEGRAIAKAAAERAAEIGYAPLSAEALYALASMQRLDGLVEDAEDTLDATIKAAQAGRHDAIEAHAWLDLAYVHTKRRNADGAERMLGFAEGAVSRLSGTVDAHVRLPLTRGAIAQLRNDIPAAEKAFVEAVDIAETAFGPDDSALVRPLSFLGGLQYDERRYGEAEAAFERALKISRRTEGERHPTTAAFEGKLGATKWKLSKNIAARRHLQRALQIRVQALGEDHADVARAHMMLGAFESSQKDIDAAERELKAALRTYEKIHGREHRALAEPNKALCRAYVGAGRLDEAKAPCERVLQIADAIEDENPKYTKAAIDLLAYVAGQQGDHARALALRRRGVELATRTWGEDSAETATSLGGVGAKLLDLGRAEEGVAALQKATAILDVERPDSNTAATAWFGLAYGHHDLSDYEAARDAATRARRIYEALGDTASVAKVDAWLADPK